MRASQKTSDTKIKKEENTYEDSHDFATNPTYHIPFLGEAAAAAGTVAAAGSGGAAGVVSAAGTALGTVASAAGTVVSTVLLPAAAGAAVGAAAVGVGYLGYKAIKKFFG